ncbi:MAG: hypothetical protein OER85_09555 [Gammaproteobacteria bacterium]|nr:hypothetical protein [Gammaproteobacteria bacterium]
MLKKLRSERGDKAILEDNMFITMFLQEVGLYFSEEDKAGTCGRISSPAKAAGPH